MVKVGVLADTHVGRSVPNVISEYRREAFRHAFTQAVNILVEEGVELVIHAGDIFEARSMRTSDSVFVKEELQRLVDSLNGRVKIVVVRGNHDGTTENSAIDYVLHPLAKYLTFLGEGTLQRKPEVFEEEGLAIVGLGYIPFVSSRLYEVRDLIREKFDASKAAHKIFLAHMFMEGQDLPPSIPEHQIASLNTVKELGANLVIAGHYHKHLPLEEKSDLLMLTPGSTEAADLSEDYPHGVTVLEIDNNVRYKFVQIKPLYMIRNEIVDSGGVVQNPSWFISRVDEAVASFSDHIKKEGRQGILRIALRGILDGNRFDLEDEVRRRVRNLIQENPHIIHVEVDNSLNEISLPEVPVSEITRREEFLREVFSVLGEKFMLQALTLAEKIREILEEKASSKTNLLKETDRGPFVEEWLKILESE